MEHAGAVDDGAAALRAVLAQLRGERLEDLGPVDRDVERVLRARDDGEERLVHRRDAELIGRHGTEDGVDSAGHREASLR